MFDPQLRRRLRAALDPRFVVEDFEPLSVRTWRDGRIAQKVEAARAELAQCHACPRRCGTDRAADLRSICRTGRYAVVSSAFPHLGEEDCLRGWNGSGTLFFSGCNLRCVFCQNADISQGRIGREVDAAALAALMIQLQEHGCHNINLVTPEHVVPQVVEALGEALPLGLRIPVVYNTSAYDGLDSLRLLDGLVDIYMPDFKFWHPDSAKTLLKAGDYPEVARNALREMHRQVGVLRFGPDGVARRGLLVRHLVMPGHTDESAAIFSWLARELSPDTYVNIMGQYHPAHRVGRTGRDGHPKFAAINRRPSRGEWTAAVEAARDAGLWRFDERV